MKHIPIRGSDRDAVVDDDHYGFLRRFTWHLQNGYACTRRGNQSIYMHRVLMLAYPASEVDHINGDRLDNQIANLRLATHAENGANLRKRNPNKKFKGVWAHRTSGKYYATITHNYKTNYLGTFASEEEAARAYDAAAIQLFGKFARTNFPQDVPAAS